MTSRRKPRAEDLLAETRDRPDRLLLRRLEQDLNSARQRERDALDRLAEERAKNDLVDWMRSQPKPKPVKRREVSSRLREATAVLQASDWHVGESVLAEQVQFRNEYNPDVMERRVGNLIQGYEWILGMHRSKFKIRDVVLLLQGDFVTGWLHQDQMVNNSLRPMHEVFEAMKQIRRLIDAVLADKSLESLRVGCNHGNHGRLTWRTLHTAQRDLNLEYLIYGLLQEQYLREGEKRVTFDIAHDKFCRLDIYEYVMRASHGDDVRYGGGIGGITVPITKAVRAWNTLFKADIDAMGHWHQSVGLPWLSVNGSMIGYAPYSIAIKADYEDPTQNFFLVEPTRGKRSENRIWLEHNPEYKTREVGDR